MAAPTERARPLPGFPPAAAARDADPAAPGDAAFPTSSHSLSEKDAAISADVERERIALMYRQAGAPVLAGVGFSLFVAWVVWPYFAHGTVLAWLAVRAATALARAVDVWRFHRAQPAAQAVGRWKRRHLALLALEGASWGAMGVLFAPPWMPDFVALMSAAVIGVSAVAVFSLGSVREANLMFAALVVAPPMVVHGLSGTMAGTFAGGGLAIYLALLLFEAHRFSARTVELLRLRFENAWNAEARRRALLLAERSSSAKSRFLATISHELRTPLNGILGMTQLLERSGLAPTQRSQVQVVRQSGAHLLTLIDDLLDLSRLEHGRLPIDPQPFVLRQALAEVFVLHAAAAREKGLAFVAEVAPGLPTLVVGDASRLRQVLHNLIGNALKFTLEGRVEVHVDAEGLDAARPTLRIVVSDTGPGIPAADRERVFEPFEQMAGAGARGGTGLGLAISRELARAMGGEVVLRRSPPPGCQFVFTMPLVPAHGVAPPAPAAPRSAHALTPLRGAVLLVDDSPVNALVAQAMLERFGLEVTLAQHGEQALELLERERFALVLMDCQMPVLDGLEATRRWRERERERGTRLPIVALTANALASERERCLAAGMDDVLVKPFEIEALHRFVQRQLVAA